MRTWAGLMLAFVLAACSEDRGVEGPLASPLAGTWVAGGDTLRIRTEDSSISASGAAFPVRERSIWLASGDQIFQILYIDYIRLQLERAKNPIGYAGSAWTAALVSAAIQAYKFRLNGNELCLSVGSFQECYSK